MVRSTARLAWPRQGGMVQAYVESARLFALQTVIHRWQLVVHIDPAGVPEEHFAGSDRRLPPGINAWQVYTDYLQKLHTAAVARLKSRRGVDLFDRLSARDRVQYILTIPAAWQSHLIPLLADVLLS